MADLNKFYRSKEKIREAISYLLNNNTVDAQEIKKHIDRLKASMEELDLRLKKLLGKDGDSI